MENTVAQSVAQPVQRASRIATIRSIASSVLINGALPLIIYWALKNYTHISEFFALVASGIPSLIHSIVGIIRRKRIDFLAGIIIAGIVISLIITFLGGSPKVYLIRESFFTVGFGLVYLISLLFPRPLAFYHSRYFVVGDNAERILWFNSLWQYANFRHMIRVMTAVWGVGLLLEAAIRIYLVIILSTQQFLIVSPFVINGILGGLVLWTVLYGREGRKRGEEAQRRWAAVRQENAAV